MPAVDAVVAVRTDGGMRTGWDWIPKPGRWNGCFRSRDRNVAPDITVDDRSKRMRIHRPFIFIASLALVAWCTLMGVLVLIHGFKEQGLRCGKLCSLQISIRLLLVIEDSNYWWRWGSLPQR